MVKVRVSYESKSISKKDLPTLQSDQTQWCDSRDL